MSGTKSGLSLGLMGADDGSGGLLGPYRPPGFASNPHLCVVDIDKIPHSLYPFKVMVCSIRLGKRLLVFIIRGGEPCLMW